MLLTLPMEEAKSFTSALWLLLPRGLDDYTPNMVDEVRGRKEHARRTYGPVSCASSSLEEGTRRRMPYRRCRLQPRRVPNLSQQVWGKCWAAAQQHHLKVSSSVRCGQLQLVGCPLEL